MRNVYSDPTANTAIANVMREMKRKEQREAHQERRKCEKPKENYREEWLKDSEGRRTMK